MHYTKISNSLDFASKVCGVMIAPAIVLSTAATITLFPLTVLLSLAAGNWREKFNLILYNPVALVFLIFCALFLVGILYSTASWSDILIILRKYDKFLLAVMLFPIFTQEKWRNYAIGTFMIAILIMLIVSYLKSYGWLQDWFRGPVEVFKPSIEFNFLMAFAAYLCLFKITATRCCRLAWGLFLLVIIYTVLFRGVGRSGYFVFVGLIILFSIQKFRWQGLVIAIAGLVLLLSLAFQFSPTFKSRMNAAYSDIKTFQQNDITSVGLRMTFVKNSLELIKAHPILGTGTGSFAKEYAEINTNPATLIRNPHNEYLHIMVQFGTIGLIILLLFFGVPWWYSQFLPDGPKYIARGTILGIMLGCLANSWLLDVTTGHFYAYFIALAFAALPIQKIRPNFLRVGGDTRVLKLKDLHIFLV